MCIRDSYSTPVYETPIYGTPVEQLPPTINRSPEPIYSQPREFDSQSVPIVVPPEDDSSELPMLNFTDEPEPRSSIGTETLRSPDPSDEPSEEAVFEFFEDGN